MITTINIQTHDTVVFDTFAQWVNKASSWIGGYDKRRFVLIAIDKEGYVCQIGEDWMAADENKRFPVTCYFIPKSATAQNEE